MKPVACPPKPVRAKAGEEGAEGGGVSFIANDVRSEFKK